MHSFSFLRKNKPRRHALNTLTLPHNPNPNFVGVLPTLTLPLSLPLNLSLILTPAPNLVGVLHLRLGVGRQSSRHVSRLGVRRRDAVEALGFVLVARAVGLGQLQRLQGGGGVGFGFVLGLG